MRFLTVASLLCGASTTIAASCSDCSPTPPDIDVLKYAWALQAYSYLFYSSNSVNTTDFSSAPNSSVANYYPNFQGIQEQNLIGIGLIQDAGANATGFQTPECDFTVLKADNSTELLYQALYIEDTLTGAFAGLSQYTQATDISLLINWLSIHHGNHATYIASFIAPIVFLPNGTSHLPILPPDYVLSTGDGAFKLGDLLGGCVTAPKAPCS